MKKFLLLIAIAACFSFTGNTNVKAIHLNTESECFSTVWEREAMLAMRMLNISGSGGVIVGCTIANAPAGSAYCYELSWIGTLPPED